MFTACLRCSAFRQACVASNTLVVLNRATLATYYGNAACLAFHVRFEFRFSSGFLESGFVFFLFQFEIIMVLPNLLIYYCFNYVLISMQFKIVSFSNSDIPYMFPTLSQAKTFAW